ncbi:MAG: hypothetical protein HC878_00125 [Leptolyngbyaceae cyanobacterium SL_5_14]|nr:hypothetical protein [Leptolyngbyaceae cyanobacterium SL_5_14]
MVGKTMINISINIPEEIQNRISDAANSSEIKESEFMRYLLVRGLTAWYEDENKRLVNQKLRKGLESGFTPGEEHETK